MKKLVLILLVFGIGSTLSFAQTKKAAPASQPAAKSIVIQSMDGSPTAKGKWILGPSISISSTTEDNGVNKNNTSSLSFKPEIGYFIKDDLSIGLGIGIGTYQMKEDGTAAEKNSSIFVAPILRYYLPISPKFHFLGKLEVPFGTRKTTLSGGVDVDVKSTSFGVKAIPAFAFFPSGKISIEMSLGNLYFKSEKQGDKTDNSFGFALLDQTNYEGMPSLGVKWHLGK